MARTKLMPVVKTLKLPTMSSNLTIAYNAGVPNHVIYLGKVGKFNFVAKNGKGAYTSNVLGSDIIHDGGHHCAVFDNGSNSPDIYISTEKQTDKKYTGISDLQFK